MQKAIEIENLSVYYDDVCALSNINLTVSEKEFLGIIGPNGGGKSTLVKAILGLIKPSSGSVKIYGKEPGNQQRILGYVPQFLKFDRNFPINVMDVVLMGRLPAGCRLFHRYTKEDREIAETMLEKLGMHELKERQIGQLSGGQLQRVLIARALAVQPKIILLDEPTSSVDSTSKYQIYELLNKLNEEITVIVVTHDTEAVSSHIKSLACLNTKLYYHGAPELDNETFQQVYGCPVELIAHGVPHRVLKKHEGDE